MTDAVFSTCSISYNNDMPMPGCSDSDLSEAAVRTFSCSQITKSFNIRHLRPVVPSGNAYLEISVRGPPDAA